jgi:parallel beta-helix repeat protein
MRVRSELSWRRLVVGILALVTLPALLAFAAVNYRSPDLPPGPASYNPVPLHRVPVLTALQSRELQRSRRITGLAPTFTAPTLVPPTFPEPVPTIVLPPRATAYDLSEVRNLLPAAFGTSGNAVLLQASIEVPAGAQLIVDSATTPQLRMLSSKTAYTTMIARGGTLTLRGSKEAPLQISTWDPDVQGVDLQPADGRSFLLAWGGRMDITYADIGYLGYGTGTSSGVAWRGGEHPVGQTGTPATGDVRNSVLHNNWFGAYTFEALGMQWTGNTFRDNSGYGFDPHDSSDDFLVAENVATRNGRHGFIFSRGCDRNVLRNNIAYDNRGHGFMIDDGRSEDSETAAARQEASNDNVLQGNRAYDNAGSGIEIEGGRGTVVDGNTLTGNHVGVRVKNDASALITRNTLVNSRLAGVDVLAGSGSVSIRSNRITGGWAGVTLSAENAAVMTGNRIDGPSTPMVIGGQPRRDHDPLSAIGRVFRWNPLLVLWVAILGVPMVLAVRHLFRVAGRVRHRELVRGA